MHPKLKLWLDDYARGGMEDKRALQDFVECEAMEIVRILRNELIGIANGNFTHETLEAMLGKARPTRHGSYEEWAKMMLVWLSEYLKP